MKRLYIIKNDLEQVLGMYEFRHQAEDVLKANNIFGARIVVFEEKYYDVDDVELLESFTVTQQTQEAQK